MQVTRRKFIAATAATLLSSTSRAASPNGTIRIAILGAGWRGGQLIPQFAKIPDVRIVSVCDPDSKRAAEKAKQAGELTGGDSPRIETELRRVIDDKSVDAVVSATPNHWHALSTIWACQAGKDVYVEKPVAHSLWESQQMVRAAQKYGRIVQAGTHRRSFPILQSITGRIRGGEFGRVIRGRAVTFGFRESIGKRSSPMEIPAEVDYNQWAGPAPMSPFYCNQFHYDWHWMWETGNGELGNNGAHMLDLARWGLGQDRLAPAVITIGGRLRWEDAGETPNVLVAYFDYKPAPLIAELRNLPAKPGSRTAGAYRGLKHGFCIECEDATVLGLNDFEIRDRNGKVVEKKEEKETRLHPANFIDALRSGSRDKLTCPIEVGHVSCGLALQGNVSYLLGSPNEAALNKAISESDAETKDAIERMLGHLDGLGIESAGAKLNVGPMLQFDPQSERFTGPQASQANRLRRRARDREPFVVPEVS